MLAKLPGVSDKDIGTVFKTVGMTLVSTVGGASGPLYGTFFMQAGTASAGKQELTTAIRARRWKPLSMASSCGAKPFSATRRW